MNATAVADRPVIELEKVSRVFYADTVQTNALSDVNLAINRGEFVSLTGPSGCGKSTLMAILGILDAPTAGKYIFDGQDLSGASVSDAARIRCREIGFVFQSFNLIGDLSVIANVIVPLTYRDDIPKGEHEARAMGALEKVGLTHRAKHFPSQLSGGQQQRVAIARALVGNPKILLADEPTGNLDSANSEAVMNLLLELHASGSTICMVTHDPRQSAAAQREIRMLDGKIRTD